ncbi:MAG: tRNA pseudouridine(38-40) synthase TruA [Bacteroidetes bacterium]|jgi:tRNA pseudouridine38-40 synthase|nr:tRNA pseudouridine(38-40) synthase TruA [Bacteroidota bacterium]MBT3751566.1 tRNA pseudouridine(38-40) synthase TruA [Bacteroidota bacterium]MBT4401648.1 tRNA pseudouridine(38-40) synthase TruA [Bacteroidota bacterium]MBT4408523.1 tRNA pseudouridine(38-40) synthase TruA [Bacteroidota bacterium]MBT5426980.1 tRNA pseudouridine(38-40) synthase TruA [Bacteroidota bacterium]
MLSDLSLNKRYLLELSYNGHNYHGWQMQPNAHTVQEELNNVLVLLLKQNINIVGAGRTDTGVHASHFVAHFDYAGDLIDCRQLQHKLNRFLKHEIRIDRIEHVSDDFHARFSAKSRTYHYMISREKQPFLNGLSWLIEGELEIDLMNKAAEKLLNYKDFTSFARLHADTRTNDCNIMLAQCQKHDKIFIFKIQADRFLRNMVRAIVGTLVEVGQSKLGIQDFEDIIKAKDRSKAGQSAPPQGLFLTEVDYPAELYAISKTSSLPWFF